MSGKILCAIDLGHTEEERPLLVRAKRIADLDDSELDVITVVPGYSASIVGSFFPKGAERRMLNHANAELHEFVAKTLGEAVDKKIKHIVAQGTVYEEILKVAKDVKATLIIIGAHRPGLRDFLLGPNAARVARHADCSVYIARL